MKNTSNAFFFIIITAFLSVMGIGLIIPVVPFIVTKYISSTQTNLIATVVGLLMAIYSFCQFFAAPVLGALSDKYGRRPILLLCQLGSAIGYLLFGIGGALWILFLGRVIDGLTGGDLSTLFAYVADITEPAKRGEKFGIIGATIGLGFILGPTIGGLAANISLSAPFYLAAGVTVLNMLFGIFVLPESLPKKQRSGDFSLKHLNPFHQLEMVFEKPALKKLLVVGCFYFLPFAVLQAINAVFLKDTMHFTPQSIGFIFLLIGCFDIITQGFLTGKLLPKLGEKKLLIGGFLFTALAYVCYASLPLTQSLTILLAGTVIYALGSGFFEPSFGALISHTAEPHEQGRVQGANQSMQSITRIVGPILALLFYQIWWSLPYVSCALLSIVGILLIYSKNKIKNEKN